MLTCSLAWIFKYPVRRVSGAMRTSLTGSFVFIWIPRPSVLVAGHCAPGDCVWSVYHRELSCPGVFGQGEEVVLARGLMHVEWCVRIRGVRSARAVEDGGEVMLPTFRAFVAAPLWLDRLRF